MYSHDDISNMKHSYVAVHTQFSSTGALSFSSHIISATLNRYQKSCSRNTVTKLSTYTAAQQREYIAPHMYVMWVCMTSTTDTLLPACKHAVKPCCIPHQPCLLTLACSSSSLLCCSASAASLAFSASSSRSSMRSSSSRRIFATDRR